MTVVVLHHLSKERQDAGLGITRILKISENLYSSKTLSAGLGANRNRNVPLLYNNCFSLLDREGAMLQQS